MECPRIFSGGILCSFQIQLMVQYISAQEVETHGADHAEGQCEDHHKVHRVEDRCVVRYISLYLLCLISDTGKMRSTDGQYDQSQDLLYEADAEKRANGRQKFMLHE